MSKVKKETTQTVSLSKKDMDELFRREFGLEGEIYYSLDETGDHDFGTYKVVGMDVWSVSKE